MMQCWIIIYLSMMAIFGGLVAYGYARAILRPGRVTWIVTLLGSTVLLGFAVCLVVWEDKALQVFVPGLFLAFWAASLMVIRQLITWFSAYRRDKARSGKCLLNIGYTVMHYAFLVCGVSSIILSLGMAGFMSESWTFGRITLIVFFLLIGVFCLIPGLGPLQVRENGIVWIHLIEWGRIRSYHWRKNTLVLSFTYGNWNSPFQFFFPKAGSIRPFVPSRHKGFVDEVLRQNAPR